MRRYDGITASTIAGTIATLLKDIPNFILLKFGVVQISYWQLAASAFVNLSDTDTTVGLIIGAITDLIVGQILGILIFFTLLIFGADLWWYKGLIIGNMIWFLGLGLAVNVFIRITPVDPIFRLTSLFEHQIYGLTTAFLISRRYNFKKPLLLYKNDN